MSIISQKIGSMEYLTAENIAAPHCFTTRLGGVSSGYLSSWNLGHHRGDREEAVEENYRRLSSLLDFPLQKLVPAHQTHSTLVRAVTDRDAGLGTDHRLYPQCDGLITATRGLALMVFTADCTPILLHDPVTGAVGAVHAGWRGTAGGIAAEAVRGMVRHYGCRPENIRAAIGPNIDRCCFQTDSDVPEAMLAALGDAALPHIRQVGQKYYVNLKALNEVFLRREGVKNITVSTECTACRPDRFWSHRVTGGQRGSQGAIIVCKEGI